MIDPIHDTTGRISWGWTALLYDVDIDQWMTAVDASEFASLSAAALKRWAARGVLSQIVGDRGHGRFYLYLRSELEVIWCVTHNTTSQDGAPSLRVIRAHIDDVARNGFR